MTTFPGRRRAASVQVRERLDRLLAGMGSPPADVRRAPEAVDRSAAPLADPWSGDLADVPWRGDERARWAAPRRAAAAVVMFAVVMVGAVLTRAATADADVQQVAPRAAAVGAAREASPWPTTAAGPTAAPTAVTVAGSATGASAGMPSTSVMVHVVGQVRRPGVVRLRSGARVTDAVEAAGGPKAKADLSAVNLARPVVDGEQVLVPRPGQQVAAPIGAGRPAGGDSAGPGGTGAAGPGGTVDLNTATEPQLDTLPGVGPVLAGRILQWRQEHGRFSSVDDLGEVSGIGEATLERLRPLVSV